MSKKNIVIVGGGGAGVAAAKALSKSLDSSKYELILINPLPYRIWLIATLRLVVTKDEALKKDILLPYDRIFAKGKGRFVEGTVASIDATKDASSVTLESGEKIDYHVLLLAQGATWVGPTAFPRTTSGVDEHIDTLNSQLATAKDIVLVGGGAVGIELAGEIKDQWPDKKVTIVHGDKLLLNATYPDKTRKFAGENVRARGVELILDDYVDFAETAVVQGVSTRSGKKLNSVDLVIQTRGPRPNTEFVAASLGEASLGETGLIRVRPTLQLAGHDNIFAAGDAIDWAEQKQATKSGVHGALVGANIHAFLNNSALKPYKGSYELILITNGKNGGIGYFGFFGGITLGNWVARLVKSKSLLVPLFKGDQGY